MKKTLLAFLIVTIFISLLGICPVEANGEMKDLSPEDIEKYNYPVTNVQIEKNDRSILEDVDVISQNHSLEEELEFERQVGRIIDDKLAIKNTYEMAATSLDVDTRKEVLDRIVEIYNRCNQQEMFLLDIYFDGAIEAIDGEYKVQIKEKLNSIKSDEFEDLTEASQLLSRNNYNSDDAVWYAETYYENYNSSYPDLTDMGGDCANFVSQILHYGGYWMRGDWYIYKKNSQYPRPETSYQLDYSWDLADPSPWISAKEFNKFWSDRFVTKTIKAEDFTSNNYFSIPYYKGDPVMLLKKSWFSYYGYHTMFIHTYVNNSLGNMDFGVAYHTNNRIERPLVDVVKAFMNNGGTFKVRFFDATD